MQQNISWELVRTLAEEAWDRGDLHDAARLGSVVDAAMLAQLQNEGSQAGADEVPLVMPADRA